jgi:threonylcarbamoyladenosine tRNA methylthiotransferase MtaB
MENLAEAGYKEIVLTGVHIASYGRDIGTDFLELVKNIENERIVKRVRLTSLDPADTNQGLIEFVSGAETICPQFHVALQSGDEGVLRRMRRRYTPEKFLTLTNLIRRMIPDASIGSDIMVGFPGETDDEFRNTYIVARESPLTYFHVFPYSKRKLTPAASMPSQVHPEKIKERSAFLRELGSRKKTEFFRSFIGRTLPVLVETGGKGTTPNYIPVRLPDEFLGTGTEIEATITAVENEEAVASLIRSPY